MTQDHEEQMLENDKPEKWYFRTSVLVIALLCVGPLALPLQWFNPRFSLKAKIITSVLVVIATYLIGVLCGYSFKLVSTYLKDLQAF